MTMFFTQIYKYDNNKNIYMLIYKKVLKIAVCYMQDAYKFLKEKLGSEKRENNYFFVNST